MFFDGEGTKELCYQVYATYSAAKPHQRRTIKDGRWQSGVPEDERCKANYKNNSIVTRIRFIPSIHLGYVKVTDSSFALGLLEFN